MQPLLSNRLSRPLVIRWLVLAVVLAVILEFCTLDFSSFGVSDSPLSSWLARFRPALPKPAPPTCPSLHHDGANETALQSRERPLPNCMPLNLTSDEFTASACFHPAHCDGFDIHIERTDQAQCAEVEGNVGVLNTDVDWEKWTRERLGPDGFMLMTDGAERQAVFEPAAYEGSCKYRFSVDLHNGGPVNLHIWLHYSDYAAWNESDREWPQLKHEQLLFSSELPIGNCSHCQSQTLSGQRTWFTNTNASDDQAQVASCSPDFVEDGAFLPVNATGEPAPQYAFQSSCAWSHAGLRFSDHAACFPKPEDKPLSMFFIGDSHVRVAYDGIIHRLQGNTDAMVESEKSGDKHTDLPGISMRFLWDPAAEWMRRFECKDIENYTHLGISFGRHLQGMSTAEWRDRLNTVLARLTHLSKTCSPSSPPPKLVWLAFTGVVPRDDHFPRDVTDRGTNLRNLAWSRMAWDVARARGWDTVDYWRYTLPFVRETPDLAHFLMTDGFDPFLDNLIGTLGICG